MALALGANTEAAGKLDANLDKAFPLDTVVQRYWLPTIGVAVALQRNNPSRAVELLTVTSAIELGEPLQNNVTLCPVYLRGQGYLMLRDGKAAAAEFQKFIDRRGLVGNSTWGAFARLGMARAYAVQGEPPKRKSLIGISSRSGKTPTPMFRSRSK